MYHHYNKVRCRGYNSIQYKLKKMKLSIEIIGLVAAVLTTSSFIPQVIKTKKTKSVENLSLSMYLTMFTGVVLWLIYGLYINSVAVILANAVTAVLTLMLLNYKIRFSKK